MKNIIAKEVYVLIVRLFSVLFRGKKLKNKISYLMSFPKNDNGFIKALLKEVPNVELVVFYTPNVEEEAKKLEMQRVKVVPLYNKIEFIKKAIRDMSESKVIICDNYFPILAGFLPKREVSIMQIWHANGAIKKFGLEEKSINKKTWFDKRRYKQVYNTFNEYIVGSEMMGEVFKRSYGASEDQIKLLGNPRTDAYLNITTVKRQEEKFYSVYPELKSKKIILYAPTYRNIYNEDYPLDVEALYQNFKDDYVLLFRTHPHSEKEVINKKYQGFCYSNLDEFGIDSLLPVTDILITDYSSIPFDFTLLENAKQIIFYCYDLDEYAEKQGIQKDFLEWVPGDIVYRTSEIIKAIKANKYTDYSEFNLNWNKYNDGKSIQRLIEYLSKKFV